MRFPLSPSPPFPHGDVIPASSYFVIVASAGDEPPKHSLPQGLLRFLTSTHTSSPSFPINLHPPFPFFYDHCSVPLALQTLRVCMNTLHPPITASHYPHLVHHQPVGHGLHYSHYHATSHQFQSCDLTAYYGTPTTATSAPLNHMRWMGFLSPRELEFHPSFLEATYLTRTHLATCPLFPMYRKLLQHAFRHGRTGEGVRSARAPTFLMWYDYKGGLITGAHGTSVVYQDSKLTCSRMFR